MVPGGPLGETGLVGLHLGRTSSALRFARNGIGAIAMSPYVRSLRARELRERTASGRDSPTRYVRSLLDVNDMNETEP